MKNGRNFFAMLLISQLLKIGIAIKIKNIFNKRQCEMSALKEVEISLIVDITLQKKRGNNNSKKSFSRKSNT